MDTKNTIKKMIKEVNDGDYSDARESLKTVIEKNIQERISDAMGDQA